MTQAAKAMIISGASITGYFFRSLLLYIVNNTITNNASANIRFVRVMSVYLASGFIPIHMVKNTPGYQDQQNQAYGQYILGEPLSSGIHCRQYDQDKNIPYYHPRPGNIHQLFAFFFNSSIRLSTESLVKFS
jgi:hypothetical protein